MPGLMDVPGLGGYLGGQQADQAQQMGQLQQLGLVQGILAKQRAQQQLVEFRGALSQAKTPDEQLSVASKYMGPDALGKMIQDSQNRQASIAATKEAAAARLTEAANNFNANYELKKKAATTAEERVLLDRQKAVFDQKIKAAAAQYNIGADVMPTITGMPQGAPTAAPSPLPAYPDALAAAKAQMAAGQPVGTIQTDPNSPQPINQPVAAPAPVPAPSPAPVPGPAPTPAPTPAPQSAIPPMPPEVARLPKSKQDAWMLDQAKKGTAGNQASENIVDLIGTGKMAVPSSFALRSPYWIDALERVGKKYPNFDASVYQARQAARRTFASGPEAKNVTSMNTLIGHLGTMADMADKLNNSDFPAANAVINRMKQEMGDPTIVNFNTAKTAVAEETMRVFRQVGASDAEATRWGNLLTSSGSPAQLQGNISTVGKLLDSRITAIADQYERTVNQGGNPARVMPENRKTLDKMIGGGSTSTTPNDMAIAVKRAGGTYEPQKYDYRIAPDGSVQRKAK